MQGSNYGNDTLIYREKGGQWGDNFWCETSAAEKCWSIQIFLTAALCHLQAQCRAENHCRIFW